MKQVISLYVSCFIMFCASNAISQKLSAKSIDENKTKVVLKHHDEAFGSNDLDAVMEDYTEESVLVTPDGTYTGLKELRGLFEEVFKLFPKDSIDYTLISEVVTQDIALVVWKATTPKIKFDYATETFIIQNGKIVRQTFAGH